MEPYIRINTELRKQPTSDFEKDLYKLMNNSVFGKTMENLRKRVDVKLLRSNEEDKLRHLIASPAFAPANIFDDDLEAIQVHKSRLVLNRPVYVEISILDPSKNLLYDFYYKKLRRQYKGGGQLLYTDTDSLLVKIRTKYHPLHSIVNKKVVENMKDKCAGRPIAEYVSLRPNMYSIPEASGQNIKLEGMNKSVVKKQIRQKQYREGLFEKQTFRHSLNVLRSERHYIYGQRLNKVSLSPFDSKRWIAKAGWSCWLTDTGKLNQLSCH